MTVVETVPDNAARTLTSRQEAGQMLGMNLMLVTRAWVDLRRQASATC